MVTLHLSKVLNKHPLTCINNYTPKDGRPAMVFLRPPKEDQPPPMYDLIIGLEILSKWKAILNFHDEIVTINQVKLPTESLQSLSKKKLPNNLYQEATKPAISQVATNQVTQILDANYENTILPK
eukprot:8108372-Ditylum_brightwellii.AAC.1